MEQIIFAQITDTHIGRRLMENWLTNVPLVSGYNPHDDRLFEALFNALEDAKLITGLRDNEPFRIVMGGDLTAGGTNNDYAIALGVFSQRWRWYRGTRRMLDRHVGYAFPEQDVVMVPGNHDHWRSNFKQRAYIHNLAPHFFQQTPWRHEWAATAAGGGTLKLELFGVDSNSGMTGKLFNVNINFNLPAGGALSLQQMQGLGPLVNQRGPQPPPGTVRAFVCHHAFEPGKGAAFGFHLPQPLDRPSRTFLSQVAALSRVPVILTGHTHEFDYVPWREPASHDPAWTLHEFRSAAALAGPAKPGGNGFWVHRIRLDAPEKRPVWTAWKYQTAGGHDFELDDVNGTEEFNVPA